MKAIRANFVVSVKKRALQYPVKAIRHRRDTQSVNTDFKRGCGDVCEVESQLILNYFFFCLLRQNEGNSL